MSILLHSRQGTSTRWALWTHTHRQVQVKFQLVWLPGSDKANCNELGGKRH